MTVRIGRLAYRTDADGNTRIRRLGYRTEISAVPPAADTDQLATLQTLGRGFGQVRAARLGGELQ